MESSTGLEPLSLKQATRRRASGTMARELDGLTID